MVAKLFSLNLAARRHLGDLTGFFCFQFNKRILPPQVISLARRRSFGDLGEAKGGGKEGNDKGNEGESTAASYLVECFRKNSVAGEAINAQLWFEEVLALRTDDFGRQLANDPRVKAFIDSMACCSVRLNAFAKIKGNRKPQQGDLFEFAKGGLGIKCMDCQQAFDLIVPLEYEFEGNLFYAALFVQVKNQDGFHKKVFFVGPDKNDKQNSTEKMKKVGWHKSSYKAARLFNFSSGHAFANNGALFIELGGNTLELSEGLARIDIFENKEKNRYFATTFILRGIEGRATLNNTLHRVQHRPR